MGFSGLNIAVSGINAARVNLAVTGHNMANAEIRGYSRQRIIQQTAPVRNLGVGVAGTPLIHNMGTDRQAISQMRDKFLDFTYREQVSKLEFYSVLAVAGAELESMLGELHSGFSLQNTITDIWSAIQELTSSPGSLDTRSFLISKAGAFLTKAQSIYNNMVEYQFNLDNQIRQTVDDINRILLEIQHMNDVISRARASGDNPNDFLDRRNLLLDQLSELIPIETRIDGMGNVMITSGRHEILNGGFVNTLGLRFTSDSVSFVEPVFTNADYILSSGTPQRNFVSFMDWNRGVHNDLGNDMGRLVALMLARGSEPVTNLSPASNVAIGGGLAVYTINNWSIADNFTDWSLAGVPAGSDVGAGRANFIALAESLGLREPTVGWDAQTQPQIVDAIAQRISSITGVAAGTITTDLNAIAGHPGIPGTPTPAQVTAFNALLNPIRNVLRDEYSASRHNHNMLMWSIEHSTVSQAQLGLDKIVMGIVNLINDTITGQLKTRDVHGNIVWAFPSTNVNPNFVDPPITDPTDPRFGNPWYTSPVLPQIPVDANGRPGNEPIYENGERISETGELFVIRPQGLAAGGMHAEFTIRNLAINTAMQGPGGHNRLALSLTVPHAPDDDRLLLALQAEWQRPNSPYAVMIAGRSSNIQDAYIRFASHIAVQTQEAMTVAGTQTFQVIQADSRRNAIKGVSMDEEMTNMLRFQFAFQSASRMLNVMDSMIDRIVNGMGAGRG